MATLQPKQFHEFADYLAYANQVSRLEEFLELLEKYRRVYGGSLIDAARTAYEDLRLTQEIID